MVSLTTAIETGGKATLVRPHKHKNQVPARAATAYCENRGPEETEGLAAGRERGSLCWLSTYPGWGCPCSPRTDTGPVCARGRGSGRLRGPPTAAAPGSTEAGILGPARAALVLCSGSDRLSFGAGNYKSALLETFPSMGGPDSTEAAFSSCGALPRGEAVGHKVRGRKRQSTDPGCVEPALSGRLCPGTRHCPRPSEGRAGPALQMRKPGLGGGVTHRRATSLRGRAGPRAQEAVRAAPSLDVEPAAVGAAGSRL